MARQQWLCQHQCLQRLFFRRLVFRCLVVHTASVDATATGASASGKAAPAGGGAGGHNATAAAGGAGFASEEDELRHYFRQVDAAHVRAAVNASAAGGGHAGVGIGGGLRRGVGGVPSAGAHRMWRMVPGGVHDIIEGEGSNRTFFSVEGLRPPNVRNGSFVVDAAGLLDATTLGFLNKNLTWVEQLTPFRVLLLVLPKLPADFGARRLYAAQLLRARLALHGGVAAGPGWVRAVRAVHRAAVEELPDKAAVIQDGLVGLGHRLLPAVRDGGHLRFAEAHVDQAVTLELGRAPVAD